MTIDYTTRRLGSRTESGRVIRRCPTCGRKGEYVRYTDGTANVAHGGRYEFGLPTITDHCPLKATAPA